MTPDRSDMRYPWFARNRQGQALMEYVLLIALVATCLVAILGLTRKAANDAYARTAVQLGPMRGAGFGSSGGSWHSGGGGSGNPPADADSVGGSTDPGSDPDGSDTPVSAFSSGAR
jgi:Flp pilus assembly pilin Flp